MIEHGIEVLKVIFLGIVEGITEWLPISSTGHMLLVDEFLQMNVSEAFKDMFFVVIQLGGDPGGGDPVLGKRCGPSSAKHPPSPQCAGTPFRCGVRWWWPVSLGRW